MPVKSRVGGQGRIRTGRIGGQTGSGSSPGSPAGDSFLVFQTDFTAISSLPAEVSLSRATTGTYLDGSGVLQTAAINAARFDHNLTSPFAAIGLLIEEQRTNLMLQSSNPSDVAWTKDSGGSINATTRPAPDGTNTASTFTTSSNGGRLYQSYVSNSGQQYSLSRWIRRRTGSGAVKIWNQTNTEIDITSQVSSVWNRVNFTDTSSGTGFNMLILGISGDEIDIYAADTELGSFVTSYIPTTTATVTRSADVPSSNSPLTGYLAAGPSVWEFQDEATGTIARTAYVAGAFNWPVNKWYRSMGVYSAGTDTSGHMTVGSPY
jgi:hypothetical protein